MKFSSVLILIIFLNLSNGADICGSKGLKKFIKTIYLPHSFTEKATIDVTEVFRFLNYFRENFLELEKPYTQFDQIHELKKSNLTPIAFDREVTFKLENFSDVVKYCKEENMTVYSPKSMYELSELKELATEKKLANFTFFALTTGKYLLGMSGLTMLGHNPSSSVSSNDGLVTFSLTTNKLRYGDIQATDPVNVVCTRDSKVSTPPDKNYVSPWINALGEFMEVGRELFNTIPLAMYKLEQYPTALSPPADYVWSSSVHLGRIQDLLDKLKFDKDINPRNLDDLVDATTNLRKLFLAMKQFADQDPPKLTINLPTDHNIEEVEFLVEQRAGTNLIGSYTSTKWYPGSLYQVLPYRTSSDLRPADAFYILSNSTEFDQMIAKDGLICDNLISPFPKCQIDYSSILHKSCSDYYKFKNTNTYSCELERNTGPLISVTDCLGEPNVLISTPNVGTVDVRCMDGSSELVLNPGVSFIKTPCSLNLDGILIHPMKRNALVSKTRIVKQEPIDFKLDLTFEQQLLQKKLLYIGIPGTLSFVFVIICVALKEQLIKSCEKVTSRFRRQESVSSAAESELRPINNPVSVIVNNMVPPASVQSPVYDMPRLRQF